MADLTAMQRETLSSLTREYGEPKFVRIEHTDASYALVWIHTEDAHLERNFFVKPDGTRHSWRTL